MLRITRGLDLPITNAPEQKIYDGPPIRSVALLSADYFGMKPTMAVAIGDTVKRGQLLFEDKKNAGVRFTSPVAGRVADVIRGAKRAFHSVVVEVDGDDEVTFASYPDVTALTREQVVANLNESGFWTALRTRPFSRVPGLDEKPHSLFITATDTNPLCARPEVIITERGDEFRAGVQVLSHLTDGKVFLVSCPGVTLPGEELPGIDAIEVEGPHPAGLPGTHIHLLDPVSESKTVWHIGYQDVIAIGHLFRTGKLDSSRVISLAGPGVKNPRLVRTVTGAAASDLTDDQLNTGEMRVISGSVLSGRTMDAPNNFLGRYHVQVSALVEGREREFLGWQKPGFDKFSIKRVFASSIFGRNQKYNFTTSTGGSRRAMVPIGMYEDVMPLDILPTFLLRALIMGDTEQAAALGALELDEEDLALCTFVCPGKYDYGPLLRDNLTMIEKDG
ncbi:MAG: Na(+)-translocating NADH-quinone reductase subunit A [Planctomycetota bacterium]|nr:Na(+)-translocating NADH-quinone reductase subunit A [Planctomycetota bacterium]MDA1249259.1 Na(+)-translocating NADH-quinone reductase subunit A [Planctomycetota bacterium]